MVHDFPKITNNKNEMWDSVNRHSKDKSDQSDYVKTIGIFVWVCPLRLCIDHVLSLLIVIFDFWLNTSLAFIVMCKMEEKQKYQNNF